MRWEGGKRVDGVETERYEPMRNQKKKKKKCIIVGCFIFSLVELLQWVRGEVGEGQESSGGGWDTGVEGSLLCVRVFFVLFCAYRAGYQLLSGDGSLSRCMAALWCLILSRYSC